MNLELALSFVLIGFGVCVVASFLGFGGGTIIVPFLPLLTGIDIKTTIATSLVIVTLNAVINTYSFQKQNLIEWPILKKVIPFTVLAAVLSSFLTNMAPKSLVTWLVVGVFTGLLIISIMGPGRSPEWLKRKTPRNFFVAGIGVGSISGLSGIGGGTFLVPMMLAGRWTDSKKISPSGNAINMFSAGTGALTLILNSQEVLWSAVLPILGSSIFFGIFMRKHQRSLSDHWRRMGVIIYLACVIGLLLQNALK